LGILKSLGGEITSWACANNCDFVGRQLPSNLFLPVIFWRRREDLNLRNPLGVNLISSEAH